MVFCWFARPTYTASFLALNKQQKQQITQLEMLQSYSIKIIIGERLFEINKMRSCLKHCTTQL